MKKLGDGMNTGNHSCLCPLTDELISNRVGMCQEAIHEINFVCRKRFALILG